MAAGHSLGEFSALTAIGALSFEDGLKWSVHALGHAGSLRGTTLTMAAVLNFPTILSKKYAHEISQTEGLLFPLIQLSRTAGHIRHIAQWKPPAPH
jgi:[acyl-carrier-protein] S-malonyltransferase